MKMGIFSPIFNLDKDIKDRTDDMATKRKRYIYDNVIEVEEHHDGRYGAPGRKRDKKKKATPEQVEKINQYNRSKKTRRKLLEYFKEDDWYLTLTYKKELRPQDMKECKKHFSKMVRILRKEYKKRGYELFWIRNIENTRTNNWHIHLVVNQIPDINPMILFKKIWPYGAREPKLLYEEGGFRELADYITKTEKTKRIDHEVTEASYSSSKNMPLTPPKEDVLTRWQKYPKEKEGWMIDKNTYFEGINPVTGYKYRHYTMMRIERRESDAGRNIHRHITKRSKKQKSRICRNRDSTKRKSNRPKNRSS